MGTDIHGAIECRPGLGLRAPHARVYALDLELACTTRNYDAFGCLFGVMNFAGFDPVAAGRGLPADAAAHTRDKAAGMLPPFFGMTWIGWDEIEALEWDHAAPRPDARLHEYRRDDAGAWRYAGKGETSASFAAQLARTAAPATGGTWPAGTEWLIGDRLYRSEILTRNDAIRPPETTGTASGLLWPRSPPLTARRTSDSSSGSTARTSAGVQEDLSGSGPPAPPTGRQPAPVRWQADVLTRGPGSRHYRGHRPEGPSPAAYQGMLDIFAPAVDPAPSCPGRSRMRPAAAAGRDPWSGCAPRLTRMSQFWAS